MPKFTAEIRLDGKTATGIPVPTPVVEGMDAGKRFPVVVTIDDYSYRSTVGMHGGEYMIPLSAEHRARAGVAAGDRVDVTVEVDTEPRSVELPAELAAALGEDADSKIAFEALSYSHQRQLVLSIEGAKSPETRQRRIEKALATLRGN